MVNCAWLTLMLVLIDQYFGPSFWVAVLTSRLAAMSAFWPRYTLKTIGVAAHTYNVKTKGFIMVGSNQKHSL